MKQSIEPEFLRAIALRIKELCTERQMTINALAAAAGVAPSTIHNILNLARKNMRTMTIIKLCGGLGISPAEFFSAEVFRAIEH